MKKNYELVEVKVISLENEDVIRTSSATRNNGLLGMFFDFGDKNVQDF